MPGVYIIGFYSFKADSNVSIKEPFKTNLRWQTTPEKKKRYYQLRTRLETKLKRIKLIREWGR